MVFPVLRSHCPREPARTTLRKASECSTPFRPYGCAFVMGRERERGEQSKQADLLPALRYFANLLMERSECSLLEVNNVSFIFHLIAETAAGVAHGSVFSKVLPALLKIDANSLG
jgi:hypothetical protein